MDNLLDAPRDYDYDHEYSRLLRSLKRAEGFSLLFAVCNNGDTRDSLLGDLQTALPDKCFQIVPIREEVESIRQYLLQAVGQEQPDILVVHSLENWISGGVPPESIAVFATLNAARNSFGKSFPMPVVFCVPEFLVTVMMKAAPDFFSVRSGVYVFVRDEAERGRVLQSLAVAGLTEAYGLSPEKRAERIRELNELLNEYRSLPEDQRDYQAEYRLLDQLATNYFVQADYRKAERLRIELVGLVERLHGAEHPETARSLNNLAFLYKTQGKLAEAEPLYIRALTTNEKQLGSDHPDTATCLNNLAELYREQGRLSEAEPLYVRALAICEKQLGSDHAMTARSLDNLALLYRMQGRLSEAEPLYVRALSIWVKQLGNDHPDTAICLTGLADLYVAKWNYRSAEPLLVRALAIFEQVFGLDHPKAKDVRSKLASLNQKKNLLPLATNTISQSVRRNAVKKSNLQPPRRK